MEKHQKVLNSMNLMNWVKNIKCDLDRCDPVYLLHCKYELNCSHISEFMPTSPHILDDLKHFPHLCVIP